MGLTWSDGLVLDDRESVSYPDAELPDGRICVQYDRHRNPLGEVLLVRFSEDQISAGRDRVERSLISRSDPEALARRLDADRAVTDH